MWKNFVESDRPQMTIWRMRIARWITKSTATHSAIRLRNTVFIHGKNGCKNTPKCYVIRTMPTVYDPEKVSSYWTEILLILQTHRPTTLSYLAYVNYYLLWMRRRKFVTCMYFVDNIVLSDRLSWNSVWIRWHRKAWYTLNSTYLWYQRGDEAVYLAAVIKLCKSYESHKCNEKICDSKRYMKRW
jgi:hypothetical protein